MPTLTQAGIPPWDAGRFAFTARLERKERL